MLAQHLPYSRPLKSNTTHVVVRNFDDFLQTEHAWVVGIAELIERHLKQRGPYYNRRSLSLNIDRTFAPNLTQSSNEVDNRITVESNRACKNSIDGYNHALTAGFSNRLLNTCCKKKRTGCQNKIEGFTFSMME